MARRSSDQGRDELGRFVAGAGEAAEKLREFTRNVEDSTKASQDNARSRREEAEAQRALTGRVNAGLGVAGGAINAVATTGDFEAGIAHATRAGINAVRGLEVAGVRVGEFAAEVGGLNRADRILGSAAERTLDVTADLARYSDLTVSDEFRKDTFNMFLEQEKRIEAERAKVSGMAYSAENVAGLVNERGNAILERILAVLERFSGGTQ